MSSSERLMRGGRRTYPQAETADQSRNAPVIRPQPSGVGREGDRPTATHPAHDRPLPSSTPSGEAGVRQWSRTCLDDRAAADVRRVHEFAERRGHAAGSRRAKQDVANTVAAAGALAAQLEDALPRDEATLASLVAKLALAVAGRILEAEVVVDPTRLVAVLERAIGTINGSPDVRVLLHPDAVRPMRDAWEAAHGTAYLGKSWHFEADRSLPPGGCMVRYGHGFVDASLDAQLRAIEAALDGRVAALIRDPEPGVV